MPGRVGTEPISRPYRLDPGTGDWFAQNAPEAANLSPAEQTYANQTAAREAYYAAHPGQDPTGGFSQQEKTRLADIAGAGSSSPSGSPSSPSSNGTPGHTTLSPQQYVEAWRQQHPNIHLRQSDPTGWDTLAADMKAVGFNVSLDSRSDGMHKGIMLDGQFVKLADGRDNPIWQPGSGSAGGGEGGGGGNQYALQSTAAGGNQPLAPGQAAAFTYQPFTDQFTNPAFQAPTGLTEENDPGYQERLRLGTQAIDRGAAAKGTLLTGGTLQDEQQFGQALASNEYGNLYNRAAQTYGTNSQNAFNQYQQKYNQYQQGFGRALEAYNTNIGVGQQGWQNAFNQAGQQFGFGQQGWQNVFNQSAQNFGQNQQNWQNQYNLAFNPMLALNAQNQNAYSNRYGDLVTNQGNADAAGQVGSANAWNTGLGGVANMGQNYLAGMYRRPPPASGNYGAGNPYGY